MWHVVVEVKLPSFSLTTKYQTLSNKFFEPTLDSIILKDKPR